MILEVVAWVASFVYLTHAACANSRKNLLRSESRPGRQQFDENWRPTAALRLSSRRLTRLGGHACPQSIRPLLKARPVQVQRSRRS